ncbi:hypothetical protein I3842_10G037300 [Carya illinoinensis]|uniref:Uncharacterized protein n=1 Tax=Carya illinoinensis TaxID=32201 RepID=A0A922DV59_CARIL|nr:hypothetical protein I3842_10G037300 [Carya illinoinensis]
MQTTLRDERIKMFKEAEEIFNEVQIMRSKTPKIQKVISLLRDHEQFVKYHEPRVVSLGPIHHGKENYQPAEKFKSQLANEFVKNSDKTIEEICEELRECFEEEVTKKYNDVDLAWILVIDGCAILQYIDLAIKDKFKDFGIKNDSVAFCEQDLFLLENQVPYRLLELLMGLSKVGNELRDSVGEFIRRNQQMVLMDNSSDPQSWKPPENPTHLLDLLRASLLGNAKENEKTEGNRPTNQRDRAPKRSSIYSTVQMLKAAGIHVKRSEGNSLRNIAFGRNLINCLPGVLWLPPLIGITSYVSFLDSLIDNTNDVKELRKANVLFNLLGSDEDVAELFNEIGTNLVPDDDEHNHVWTQIQKYCDKKRWKWLGELRENYFKSPWTVLAFLGALLALALSATQTWYTVDSPPGPCDKFCEKFNQNL